MQHVVMDTIYLMVILCFKFVVFFSELNIDNMVMCGCVFFQEHLQMIGPWNGPTIFCHAPACVVDRSMIFLEEMVELTKIL